MGEDDVIDIRRGGSVPGGVGALVRSMTVEERGMVMDGCVAAR